VSCQDTARRLDAYVDGELDVAGNLALEDHLRGCAGCRAALARLNALRAAMQRNLPAEAAPEQLRDQLQAKLAPPLPRAGLSWRWGLALAMPGVAALAIALWLAFSTTPALSPLAPQSSMRVVYHISSTATARGALRNLANHLKASPEVRIVVVAHNDGVDFLLRGARDETGEPFEPEVKRFLERGVDFRVCYNTLERRRIGASEVIPAATLVPSGIAEISRLQSKEGYSYMRL
jgi:intracellular sulfur oxidation DsrE/DsrF family protein